MDEPGDAPARRGRLHGRLLQVLGGFSALVAVVALWQFGVFGGDPDREPVGTVDGPATDWFSVGEDGASTPQSVEAASSAVESASESSAEATTAAPSDAATSSAAESETSAREEEDESEEEDAPAAASCTATLSLDEEWDDEVSVSVEVVNTGDAELDSWAIDLDIDDMDVYHYWNMRELGWDWYGNQDWNGRLDPGEDAVVGFQADTYRGFDLPDSVSCMAE